MAKDIVQNALLEAKRAREVAMENAKDILIESLSPRLERVLNDKFNNLSEEEEEVGVGDRPEDANDRDEESWAGGDEAGEADGDNITEEEDDLEEDDIDVDAEDAEAVEDVEPDYAEEGVYEDDEEADEDEDVDDDEVAVDVEEDDEELDLEGLFYEEEDEDELEEDGDVDVEDTFESRDHSHTEIVKERNALRKANKILTKELRESNLFNVKLSHALRLLESNGGALTGKQRKSIVSSLDRAKTVREAHLIARSIHESLKVANESPRRKRIHESASRKTRVAPLLNEDTGTDRWAALAGIME